MELLRRVAVQPERAVLIVTHDSRVFDYGDRIVSMSDGRIEKIEERTQQGGVTTEVTPEETVQDEVATTV